jgi:hypothetical protein
MANVLLHIGFPKCGSKYLQQWYEKHPAMYYQPKHIAMGFYNAWKFAESAESIYPLPQTYVLSCEDLTVWQSPSRYDYYGLKITHPYDFEKYKKNICEMLYGLYPTAKILIVTRGYSSLFKSLYSQHIAMAGTLSFGEFMDANTPLFSSMLDYTYTINLYRQRFGTENVIVLPYELMRDNASDFLARIEKVVGIENSFIHTEKRIHKSYAPKVLSAHLNFSQTVYGILSPLPYKFQQSLYLRYMLFVRKREPQPFFVWLSKFMKKEINLSDIDKEVAFMKGKADILKNESLYAPYFKEYFT